MKPAIICVVAATLSLLYVGAAKAESPPCGDPAIIDGLKSDARQNIRLNSGSVGNPLLDKATAILVPNGEFDVKITEMFTLSRSEDTRQCQATLHLTEPGRVDGTVPLLYSTVRTEDGKNIYTIQNGPTLSKGLFDSLAVNNNLRASLQEVGDEILKSAAEQSGIRRTMQAYPGLNTPSPSSSYPHSNFGGYRR